jgi:deazaflavin-dependent oxidoreductase (nitroreductase family)
MMPGERMRCRAAGYHQEMARRDASNLYGEEHIRQYRETDGEYGHDWKNGSSTLLLTTTGRRSGEPRTSPLIYGRHGDDYLVVGSRGGTDEPPGWYVNLQENPEVDVQVLGDQFRARARTATPEERPEMWREMVSHWPDYDDYQRKTSREIPVVVLERA